MSKKELEIEDEVLLRFTYGLNLGTKHWGYRLINPSKQNIIDALKGVRNKGYVEIIELTRKSDGKCLKEEFKEYID